MKSNAQIWVPSQAIDAFIELVERECLELKSSGLSGELLLTTGLGHNRILKSDFVIEKTLEFLAVC